MSKVPLDPLGDARWARIERTLFQRVREGAATPLRGRRSARIGRSFFFAAALVGTGAAAAALVLSLRPASKATSPISRIATEASPSHVVFGEAVIDVAPRSSVEVEDESQRTVVILERGEIVLRVTPRPVDRPLVVEAGDVRIRVVGTEFSVRREGDGASVRVMHGVVEVRTHGDVTRVSAGGAWPAVSEPIPSAAPVDPPPEPSASTAAVDPSPRAITPSLPSAERAPATAASVYSARAARTGDAGDAEQTQFEAAARLERSDPQTALALYAALARGSDGWAQNALYAAGRLEADRRERDHARRLLTEYLRRFPNGSNSQDARALLDSMP